jgi:hypothetical protein
LDTRGDRIALLNLHEPKADGSVDLYIQKESAGADKESNRLPAPKDKFILWKIPPVNDVDLQFGCEPRGLSGRMTCDFTFGRLTKQGHI